MGIQFRHGPLCCTGQSTVEEHLPSSPTEKFIATQRETVLGTQSLLIGDREQMCKIAPCSISKYKRSAGVVDSIHVRRDFVWIIRVGNRVQDVVCGFRLRPGRAYHLYYHRPSCRMILNEQETRKGPSGEKSRSMIVYALAYQGFQYLHKSIMLPAFHKSPPYAIYRSRSPSTSLLSFNRCSFYPVFMISALPCLMPLRPQL